MYLYRSLTITADRSPLTAQRSTTTERNEVTIPDTDCFPVEWP